MWGELLKNLFLLDKHREEIVKREIFPSTWKASSITKKCTTKKWFQESKVKQCVAWSFNCLLILYLVLVFVSLRCTTSMKYGIQSIKNKMMSKYFKFFICRSLLTGYFIHGNTTWNHFLSNPLLLFLNSHPLLYPSQIFSQISSLPQSIFIFSSITLFPVFSYFYIPKCKGNGMTS